MALFSCCAAWSQLAAPEAPATVTKPETPKDTLGRETPRGTVLGFLSAARKGNAQIAALYLNTPLRGAEAEAIPVEVVQMFRKEERPAGPKKTSLFAIQVGNVQEQEAVRLQ